MPTKSGNVRVTTVKLSDTYVDTDFQRPLNERFVKTIVDGFDEKMLGVLILNDRPDTVHNGTRYSVTDGQQRRDACLQLGRVTVPAVVFEITKKEEAALFVALQRNRRPVTPLERHKALVNSGEELAVAIDRITRHNGFRIDADSIGCITAIRDKADVPRWSLENYAKALQVMAHAWEPDTEKLTSYEVVMGLWTFFQRADIKATVEETTDALFDYMPRNIVRDAKLQVQNKDVNLGRIGSAGWIIANRFNKHHKRKGTQAIPQHVFTHSFRVKLGAQTRRGKNQVNTGTAGRQSERMDALSSGEDE